MKPNRILFMMLSMVLSINVSVLDAQEKADVIYADLHLEVLKM